MVVVWGMRAWCACEGRCILGSACGSRWNVGGGARKLARFPLRYTNPLITLSASRARCSWIISYTCSIAWQHKLHRVLVFGETGAPYWSSLL